jgi:hypothetical protein
MLLLLLICLLRLHKVVHSCLNVGFILSLAFLRSFIDEYVSGVDMLHVGLAVVAVYHLMLVT